MTKPFLKWAGGKSRLINNIREVVPNGKRLVEPFVGSGAVWLNLNFEQYLLADSNHDLINLYQILQKERKNFINFCKPYFTSQNNEKDKYYELREQFNQTRDLMIRAAIFVYLNRHGFNGMCRYNSKGEFNIPFGDYKNPVHFPEETMMEFYKKCKDRDVTFLHEDFRETFKKLKNGDVVYCDPPYTPLSTTSSFTAYDTDGFNDKDHTDLADCAINAKVPVVISNHDTESTRKIYQKAISIKTFMAGRYIGGNRLPVRELLAIFNHKCAEPENLFSEL